MITHEEEIALWKHKCASAEKELKEINVAIFNQTMELIKCQSDLSMWMSRARLAEEQLRKDNDL